MPGSTSRADADSTGPTAEAHARNRAELREIQGEMKRDRDVLAQTSNTGVAQKLDRANQCFEITKQDTGGRAGALDAGVLKLAAEIGAEQAGNLAKGSPEEFVKHLVKKFAFMNSSRINLVALGNQVDEMRVFMHVPAVTFLMGSIEKPKERKAREKRKEREAPAELVHAKHVGVEDLDNGKEDKAQNVRMKALREALKEGAKSADGRVNLFHLLVHPTSFSQTVENFFDFAFEIKDGKAGIVKDGDCVYAKKTKMAAVADFDAGVVKAQNILKLDHPTYVKLVKRWGAAQNYLLKDRDGDGAAPRKKQKGKAAAAAAASAD